MPNCEITFRHMDSSDALERRIRELIERLTRYSAHITHCRVTVERPHRHHRHGDLFNVKIAVSVPQEDIVVQHAHRSDQSHQDPYVALRDAFRAARRKLQDYEQRQRVFCPPANRAA